MIFNMAGSGGSSLNFKVVGGTVAPANPVENCIWVNTDAAITSWDFAATAPTNPVEGMVWCKLSLSSMTPINALKKNSLWFYPVTCQQYQSGVWVPKGAKTYQRGVWIDWWSGELYEAGNEYSGQTGGWVTFRPTSHAAGVAQKNADNLTVAAAANEEQWLSIAFATENSIDLSNYNSLHITATSASGGAGDSATKFGVTDTKDSTSWDDTPQAVFSDGTTTLDISAVSSGFIWFGVSQRGRGTKSAVVTKVWLT